MYKPFQIPYLLDTTYHEFIHYQEHYDSALDHYCMCIWQMQTKRVTKKAIPNMILPDACLDIIIDFSNRQINVAGFSRHTETTLLKGQVDVMGVRLRPGAFYALFHRPAVEIMDRIWDISTIDPNHSLTKLFETTTTTGRCKLLKEYLLSKLRTATTSPFLTYTDQLYQAPTEQRVADIARNLGYTNRQLRRIFYKHYGVSPKVFLNILRLHLCLTLLFEGKHQLTEIAQLSGYYDQAHFIKEIKKYTGVSPLQLLKNNPD